jgi:hypothetical protein
MDDRLDANIVEVTVDSTGKLWVNVDGRCALRIGHCKLVVYDDPIRGRDTSYANKGEIARDANDYTP